MSSTVNFTIYKDHSVAGGLVNYGNASDQHAPVGTHGSSLWVFQQLMQFNLNYSGMASIVSATLYMKSTGQTHIAFGSSPTLRAKRITASWGNSGGSEGSWSGSANPKASTVPNSTTTGQSSATNMTRSEVTWDTIDVTSIVRAWAPVAVTSGGGSANYGLLVKAESEVSSADAWEFYTQNSSYDPYIKVVYEVPVVPPPPPEEPPPPPPANVAPTATNVYPETGDVPNLSYTLNYGDGVPYPTVQWSFYDPDAGAYQSAYEVVITDSSANWLFDSGKIAGSATTLAIPALDGANVWTSGSYYRLYVKVWDEKDLVSGWSAYTTFRILFGMAEFVKDLGATPTSWRINALASGGVAYVEYNSTSNGADPGAGLGVWQTNLAAVTKQRYVRWRVWLLPSDNGTVFGQLDYVTIGYTAAGSTTPVPDIWTVAGDAVITSETRVYGSKSIRLGPTGGYVRQRVEVLPNTTYQFTARLKQDTLSTDHYISIVNQAQTDNLAFAYSSQVLYDWHTVNLEWYSGENTWVYVQVANWAGEGYLWADALKMEASPVATPWTPAQVGGGTVEAGGIYLSGYDGDTFRLKGSANGLHDTVELGPYGLIDGYGNSLGSPHGGRNLLYNGGFRAGGAQGSNISSSGWTFVQNGDSTASQSRWLTSVDWTLRDGDVDQDYAAAGELGSSVSIYSTAATAKSPYLYSYPVKVTPGLPYSFSALVGTHRASYASLGAYYYDKTGAYLDAGYHTVANSADHLGGPDITGWRRLEIPNYVAPASAQYCRVFLALDTPYTSGSDCYAFFDQVMVTQSMDVMPYAPEPRPRRQGIVFPDVPTVGDRFFRTDYNLEFCHDGTRWLSVNEYAVPFQNAVGESATNWLRGATPVNIGSDFMYTKFTVSCHVATTHSSSAYWNIDLYDEQTGVLWTGATSWAINPNVAAYRGGVQTVNVLSGTAVGDACASVKVSKTGTPGALTAQWCAYGRVVAT